MSPSARSVDSLPVATARETAAVVAEVIAPTISKGVIIRRPKMVAMAERFDLDTRAVRRLQRLRDTYGSGPLLLRVPVRSQAVILSPEHVHRVLEDSPEPFATASSEKRAALSHFQPKGVLISHGPERADRRRYNEEVLEPHRQMHHLHERFMAVVHEEAEDLLAGVREQGELAWESFFKTWFRVVRRVVFGDAARDDHELTDMVASLRADANWAFFKPKRHGLRERFFKRMQHYLDRAEPGSLASVMAKTHATEVTAPSQQVPQWLFAFDPAGMTTFRALALLATHPEPAERARKDIDDKGEKPFLRATILESLRLWPTTPAVLRQTTRETAWDNGVMPANSGVFIFAPFFHRDDARLDFAHRFAPEVWLDPQLARGWPLIPFSSGPAMCPGRNLVLLSTSTMLARLLAEGEVELRSPHKLSPGKPLPGTLNNYGLRFALGR